MTGRDRPSPGAAHGGAFGIIWSEAVGRGRGMRETSGRRKRLGMAAFVALVAAALLVMARSALASHEDDCALAIASGDYNVIRSSGTIVGTSSDDVIIGSDGRDTINAGSGDDIVCGRGGSDTINGGSGSDILIGDAGDGLNDSTTGLPAGNDVISGGSGNDFLYGDGGNDRIGGGSNNDSFFPGTGSDTCNGGSGVDADTVAPPVGPCESSTNIP